MNAGDVLVVAILLATGLFVVWIKANEGEPPCH